jgi:serine/threonine protein kinase/tetratricopeptide (TPR) repeat protein
MNETLGTADHASEVLLTEATDAFIEALDRGEQPDVEEFAQRHPAIADALRHVLPALRLLRVPENAAEPGAEPALGCLGDFRLIREIGRGGMGIVYEAEQLSLGRRVALKVLPFASTLDSKQLQRFKNEAQAAAHLHHQNIVPVYATGCERGVHYYAMQFIEGQTLAAVIADLRRQPHQARARAERGSAALPNAAHGLPAPGLLHPEPPVSAPVDSWPTAPGTNLPPALPELSATMPRAGLSTERSTDSHAFIRAAAQLGVQAAEALEHAHQLGIVHRDIKPANLLVDARGNAWITDFGLAHCQNQAGLTMSGDLVGTLRYMSPEQALAKRVLIDHRIDIYSLGVTLYELITLEPAFSGHDRQELLRQIAFEEPKAPRRLNKAIPAELETIVLKMMEKSSADRYTTAQEVADDLRRFLEDKPIRARRPSLLARMRKWSWRHRGAVSAAAVSAVLALAITSGFTAWQWRVAETRRVRAERAEHKTQAMNDFLLNDLIGAADPSEARGQKLTVEEVLDKAAVKIGGAFPDEPEVEAAVRMAIGETYVHLGLYPKAEPQLIHALELRQRLLGENHPDTLHSINELGNEIASTNRWMEAEPLLRKGLTAARPILGDDHPTTLDLLHNHAWVLANLGRFEEAEQLDRECLKIRLRLLGPEHENTLTTMRNLADHLTYAGKWLEAEAVVRECLRKTQQAFPENHPMLIVARGGLVFVLIHEEKVTELEQEARATLAMATRVWGRDHPQTWNYAICHAIALYLQGNLEAAEQLMRQAFESSHRVYGADAPWDGGYQDVLGMVFQAEGRSKEAEEMLAESVRILRNRWGAENPITLERVYCLGIVLLASGKREEAGKVLREALDAQRRVLPAGHIDIAESLYAWAEYLIEAGENRQAETALREVLSIDRPDVPRVRKLTGRVLAALGWVLTQEGRAGEGEPLLRQGLEICRKQCPARHWSHWMTADAQSRLGGCLVALERLGEAETNLLAAYNALQGARGTPPARLAEAVGRIVKLYETWDQADKAAEWRAKRSTLFEPKEKAVEDCKDK